MNTYLADGGGAYFDVYNIHCYPWNTSVPPEYIASDISYNLYALTANSLSTPAYCDEFNDNVPVSPIYTAIQYVLGWPSGMSNMTWYQFDSTSVGYMEGTNQGLNTAGAAFRIVTNWLSGATWTSNPTRQANSNKLRNTTWAGVGTGTPEPRRPT